MAATELLSRRGLDTAPRPNEQLERAAGRCTDLAPYTRLKKRCQLSKSKIYVYLQSLTFL